MKKVLSLLIALLITSSLISYKSFAMPPTSVDQAEITKLSSMALDELKAVAKPAPEDAIRHYTGANGDNCTDYGMYSKLPDDGNIYYIENKRSSGNDYVRYTKFLYVSASAIYNTVTYHVYIWDYTNGVFVRKGIAQGDETNEALYNQLTGYGKGQTSSKVYSKDRLYGLTRFDTAKAIATRYNSDKVNNVILATGYNFPDALTWRVLAKKLDAPILLAGSTIDSIPALDYIKDHLNQNGTVYILGGQGAVNETVVASIKLLGYSNIKRLYGDSRYDTNKAITQELNVAEGTPVVIATGNDYPDALSISSIAASKGYPILLTDKDTLPEKSLEMIRTIKPAKVYIIGGQTVISDAVITKIQETVSLLETNLVRLYGTDRYETSLNIAKHFNMIGDTVCFATGENFPDALAGSALAAKLNAPIILIGNDATKQKSYIDSTKYTKEILFGGIGAISSANEELLSK